MEGDSILNADALTKCDGPAKSGAVRNRGAAL